MGKSKDAKPQSLADFLGIHDPLDQEAPINPDPPSNLLPKDFARSVLDSKQYRDGLLRRILTDELPPAVEVWLLNTAYGKPVDRVQVQDPPQVEDLNIEECEMRAMELLNIARNLRKSSGDSKKVH